MLEAAIDPSLVGVLGHASWAKWRELDSRRWGSSALDRPDVSDEPPSDREPTGAVSALDIPLALSFAARIERTKTEIEQFNLRDLAKLWAAPTTRPGNLPRVDYLALDKHDPAQKAARDAQKNGQYFCACGFEGDRRRGLENVRTMSAFVLDFDTGTTTLDIIRERLAGLAYLAYTSYSHHPDHERWRVIIPYAEPVAVALHARAFEHFNALFEGDIDEHCETPSQGWYTPACPPDAVDDYQCILVDGAAFDPSSLPEPEPKKEADAAQANRAAPALGGKNVDVEELKDALGHLDADDRKQWIDVGMALKHDLGEAGFRIWLDWSRKSAKFDFDDATKTWDGLKPRTDGKAITVGTIFQRAAQAGWTRRTVPDEIAELNERCFLAPLGSKVPVFVEDKRPGARHSVVRPIAVNEFNNLYANRFVWAVNAQGKAAQIPLGKYWMQHPARRTYQGVVYSPEDEFPGYYNLWRGFDVKPYPGTWKRFRWHLYAVICRRDRRCYRYLLDWLAFAVQHPGRPAEVAVVMQGGRGAGKGLVARTVAEIFGVHAQHISNPKHLTGNFNGHLQQCSLLFVDEAFWAGDKAGESVIKQLITEPTITIERKHFDAEKCPNYLHIMMATNAKWVVPAGLDERRFFVLLVDDSRRQDHAYFADLIAEIDSGGREAMLHDLLKRNLSRANIRRAPQTTALGEQKLLSLDARWKWWFGKLISGDLLGPRRITGGPAAGMYTTPVGWPQVEVAALQDEYATSMQRQQAGRQSTATVLGGFLKEVLPPPYPIRRRVQSPSGGGRVSVYDFPPLPDCQAHFEELTGLQGRIDWRDGSVRG